MARKRNVVGIAVLITLLLGVGLISFFIADLVLTDSWWQTQIAEAGYLAITGFAFIAGLNAIIPIPAVAFTPVFVAAGLTLPGIIIALTLGTLASDFVGYWFGRFSSDTIEAKYPALVKRLYNLYNTNRRWLAPVLFLYAAFMPVPNEFIVIPLALLGVPWRIMLLPLLFGNLLNQTIYAYGIQSIFLIWW